MVGASAEAIVQQLHSLKLPENRPSQKESCFQTKLAVSFQGVGFVSTATPATSPLLFPTTNNTRLSTTKNGRLDDAGDASITDPTDDSSSGGAESGTRRLGGGA